MAPSGCFLPAPCHAQLQNRTLTPPHPAAHPPTHPPPPRTPAHHFLRPWKLELGLTAGRPRAAGVNLGTTEACNAVGCLVQATAVRVARLSWAAGMLACWSGSPVLQASVEMVLNASCTADGSSKFGQLGSAAVGRESFSGSLCMQPTEASLHGPHSGTCREAASATQHAGSVAPPPEGRWPP